MHSYQNKIDSQFKYFSILSSLYTTLLIVSVLLPLKIIDFFGIGEPGGIFLFPLTYLLGGAIAETYGRKMALQMIYSSICCLLAFNIAIAVIIRIPSMPDAPHQEIFLQAFGQSIRLSIGCFVGLIFSDLTNIYRITKLKVIFKGKYFLQRCLWTTAISEALFNFATYLITYSGVLPLHNIFKLMLSSWFLKMCYSLIMIFPSLLFMNFLKRAEGADIYDTTDATSGFNPEAIFLKFLNASSEKKQESAI